MAGGRRAGRSQRASSGLPHKAREFGELYDEQVWRVYGFFGYRLSSREEAEDLTQLTFECALKAWSRYDPSKASTTTWLLAIARNLLIDHFRRDQPIVVERVEDVEPVVENSSSGPKLDQPHDGRSGRVLPGQGQEEDDSQARHENQVQEGEVEQRHRVVGC